MNDVINKPEKKSAVKSTSGKNLKKRTSLKKKTAKGRKPQFRKISNFSNKQKLGILGIAVLIIVLIFGISSCGVSHKSPKGVVNSLVEAYKDGKEKKALKCFGSSKDATEDLKKEVKATIKYFKAQNAKKVDIEACDILWENDEFTYVYIIYNGR